MVKAKRACRELLVACASARSDVAWGIVITGLYHERRSESFPGGRSFFLLLSVRAKKN